MSAVDDLIKARTAGADATPTATPATPSGGTGAVDALIAARKGSAPSTNLFAPLGNAAKTVATGVGNALDVQRWLVAKAGTGKTDPGEQLTAEREQAGTQGIYEGMGRIPIVGHALQGASDLVQNTVTDPLTVETLGAGPVLKTLGLGAKLAGAGEAATRAVTSTPLGAAVHDFTHWGGAVAREQGPAMVNRLRGTANLAGATGANVKKKLLEDFNAIDKGLTDAERIRVGKALNGEPLAEVGAVGRDALTPKEQTAYDGLRSLTEQDLAHRTRTATIIAFNQAAKGLAPEDRDLLAQALRDGKPPEVPAPGKRVRVPGQGDSVAQRSRTINQNVPNEGIDVFRYQRTPGEAQAGAERGGTFYAVGKPGAADHYAQEPWMSKIGLSSVGGENLVVDRLAPRKPLHLPAEDGHVGFRALKSMYPADAVNDLVTETIKAVAGRGEANLTPEAQAILRKAGLLNDVTYPHGSWRAMNPGEPGAYAGGHVWEAYPQGHPWAGEAKASAYERLISSANGDATLVLDRIGLDAARAQGYDAVIAPKATEGKTTEFVDLGAPKAGNIGDLPRPQLPFTRPLENQAAVDRMKKLRGLYDDIQAHVEQNVPKREDYFPTAHEGEPLGEHVPEKTVSEKDYYDPRTKEREDIHVTDAAQMRAGFEAMAKNTGRQVKTGIINEQLDHLLDDPEIDKLFQRTIAATGNARSNTQKVKDAWLKVIGYPRAATVSLTPRHGANILDLAANTVPPHLLPQYMKDVTATTAKLLRAKSEDEYQAITKEGRELGALSGDFRERQAFFQEGPLSKVPGLSAWTRANNKLVWAIDEAAKQEYAKILVATGEAKGLEAGGLASSRLVDYAHVSPLVKALRYVAPFGTFRGSVPGAVIGGIARNPARAALLNRATGGTMYGGEPGKGQHGLTLYNPTADVGRGLDAPQDFLRGTLGAPAQAAATLGAEAATGNPGASVQTIGQELKDLPGQIMRGEFSKMGTPGKVSPYAKSVALRTARYLNYKHPIDLRWLVDAGAAGIPEAQAVLELLGASQFQAPSGNVAAGMGTEALRQSAGVGIR